MPCPATTISLLPSLLAIGAVLAPLGVGFLFTRDKVSELEANPQRMQKLRDAAAKKGHPAAVRTAAARPCAATRMRDLSRLQAALAGKDRRLTATDRSLVLTMRELTLSFEHDAQGTIIATLVRGDVKSAQSILLEAQTRYLATVRESTLASVETAAPKAGWEVAARARNRDGSIQVTLQKPRARTAVAVG